MTLQMLPLVLILISVLISKPDRFVESLEPWPSLFDVKPYQRQHQRPHLLMLDWWGLLCWFIAWLLMGLAAAAFLWA